MKTLNNIIIYISFFALLVSINGCMTTEQYSKSPEKILSGDSDVKLEDDYKLDSILFHNMRTLRLSNYVTMIIEKKKEKFLVYYYPKALFIDSALMKETNSKIAIYKKPIVDTLNFKAIDTMYFTRSKYDYSTIILPFVILLPLAIYGAFWLRMN